MPLQSSRNRVNVFANDPDAKGLTLEQVVLPAASLPFEIPGWIGAGGLYEPGTLEFEIGQLSVVLNATVSTWNSLFCQGGSWQSGVTRLPIVPRAGRDLNAYYDRASIKFYSSTDAGSGQALYACESSDVIAHECGHAILDAHRPDYWDSLLAETAAFHEAFGDISAVLVTLDNPAVRSAILKENGGRLANSNAVTRLAEQLARGMHNGGNADAVVSPDALRDVYNKFRYRSPDKLPARAPASELSSESHSFSRVFSGAFYDLLVAIYEQIRRQDAALYVDAALVRARTDAGMLLANALLLAPHGEAPFKTIAAALFGVNARDFAGRYFAPLCRAFVARNMITQAEADAFGTAELGAHTRTSAWGRTGKSAKLRMGIGEATIGEEIPGRLRDGLRLKDDFRLVRQHRRMGKERVLHYVAPRQVELTGGELGVARGAQVTLSDAIAVHVDAGGEVLASHRHSVDRAEEKRIRDHVVKLVARGRIFSPVEGEGIDASLLIERKQPYYVGYDEYGRKRIRRAFIA